jgi:hypothetical protein
MNVLRIKQLFFLIYINLLYFLDLNQENKGNFLRFIEFYRISISFYRVPVLSFQLSFL